MIYLLHFFKGGWQVIGLFERVNWVDVLTLILLIRITYISSRIGVGKQIPPLILLVLILSVSLYNYRVIAYFFIDKYSFSSSLSVFFSYFLMIVLFLFIYHVTSRVTGFCLSAGQSMPGGLEKVGGIVVGLIRSAFVIGIILIALVLVPVKFVGDSVKKSHLGSFLIRSNVKIYCMTARIIFRDKGISFQEEISDLFAGQT